MELFRHSESDYTNIDATLKENPAGSIDLKNQTPDDLTQDGKELAQEKAEAYLNSLDPKKDIIYFVSSNEARAIETANIFRQAAHEKGFEIVKHEKEITVNKEPESTATITKTKKDSIPLAQELGKGEIRTLKMLSLDIPNMLEHAVFIPNKYLEEGDINFDKVDKKDEEKFKQAQKIISDTNASSSEPESWGSNFFKHSENPKIKKLFPNLKSTKDLYEKRFQHILKLVKFADQKIKNSEQEKNIKIIAFGHENYLAYALEKHFNNHALGNCEAVSFNIDEENKITAEFKSEEKEIN